MRNSFLAITIALSLVFACTKAEHTGDAQVLTLTLDLEDNYLSKATAEDEPALNERNIAGGVDVFISGHGAFLHYRIRSPLAGQANFLTSRWRTDGVVPGNEYDVYVVANASGDLSWTGSETELKSLDTGIDNDIYRLYDPQAPTYDLSRTNSKRFIMDASVKWTPTLELEQTISVTLKRAVAKIEIDFSLSPSMAGYALYGSPQWKFVNYATRCPLLENGFAATPQLRTTPYLMDVNPHSPSGGHITTYSYTHTWTEPDDAAIILLNVPLEAPDGDILHKNYYAIPVTDISGPGPFSLDRNTLYRVNASLETPGSSGENSSALPAALFYEVIPWEYQAILDDIQVIGQEVDYFMVDPVEDEIREKVLSGGLGPRTRHLNYWSSGPVSVSAPEVYYYDKNNTKVDASDISPVSIAVTGTDHGTIDITTTALSNNAVKFIRFRAYLAGNPDICEDILIRHYPLDYIQNVEGLWSSLTTDNWVNWVIDQSAHTPQRTCSNNLFQAKVFTNGGIYTIADRKNDGYYYASTGSFHSNLKNNRMYVVQITSTSDDYTVGRVTLDAYHMSGDHLVSPAFLIASQLGATKPTTGARTAAAHCRNYKEVTADGRSYETWRLPTREEIGIIMGYQYTSDTIDEVLSGDNYWTLEGKAVSKKEYADPSKDSSSGYVRCLRDLSEAELKQINVRD